MSDIVLGLDISTSCTGWCILDSSRQLLAVDAITLGNEKSLHMKACVVRDFFKRIKTAYPITRVVIEENLQSFRPGFSSAKTLMTLARFNGIVSYISFLEFGFEPEHVNVNVARKTVGLKIVRKKDGGLPTKQQVLNWIDPLAKEYGFTWPTKVLKSGPRKGLEILDQKCYDMADAYVIALSSIKMNKKHV